MPYCRACGNRRLFAASRVPPAAPTANGFASGLLGDFNDGGELDIWGNTMLTHPNIGADQYDYAPGFGPWATCDSTIPDLTLSPDCPGKLKQVQEWRKVASAREIERY